MIYCLTGEVLMVDSLSMSAVIDCCGVGYKLTVTSSTLSKLAAVPKGTKTRVYTYMTVREDAVELSGFSTKEELDTFKLLIGVSGVGPKAAIAILSVLSPSALANAVASEDAKAIAQAPGVGAKTAARVVLELKDKLAKGLVSQTQSAEQAGTRTPAAGSRLSDARDALVVLGYSRAEVLNALAGIDPSLETEEIIRAGLAKLMKA